MAAGTGNGKPEEGSARNIDLFIHDLHSHLFAISFRNWFWTEHEKAGCNYLAESLADIGRWWQQVTRELLDDELIVRQIAIECIDDIVAIAMCVAHDGIGIAGCGLGISDDVQPMPSPAFAVMR